MDGDRGARLGTRFRGRRRFLVVCGATAGVVAFGLIAASGVSSYATMTSPLPTSASTRVLTPTDSSATMWARELAAAAPSGVSGWTVGSTKLAPPVQVSGCSVPTGSALLAANTSAGSGVTTVVQVYGAGQGASQFADAVKALSGCTSVSDSHSDSGDAEVFPDGFLLSMGDAVIGVTAPDQATSDRLLSWYEDRMSSTLTSSGCASLASSPADATRSPFYNPGAYTGLTHTDEVATGVDVSNLPSIPQSSVSMVDIADRTVTQPEAPLPSGFPVVPTAVSQPTSVPVPVSTQSSSAFTQHAVYRVADVTGPGCGWAWSGQGSPVVDQAALDTARTEALRKARVAADAAATSYVQGVLSYARAAVVVSPAIDAWNTYANKVNQVHSSWQWLDNQRDALYPSWTSYVEAHNAWLTFPTRQQQAQQQYQTEVAACTAAQQQAQQWDAQYGASAQAAQKTASVSTSTVAPAASTSTPAASSAATGAATPTQSSSASASSASPTSTPTSTPTTSVSSTSSTPTPTRPAGCTTTPTAPAIVSQSRGDEPTAPTIPAGVTVPDSWPHPQT